MYALLRSPYLTVANTFSRCALRLHFTVEEITHSMLLKWDPRHSGPQSAVSMWTSWSIKMSSRSLVFLAADVACLISGVSRIKVQPLWAPGCLRWGGSGCPGPWQCAHSRLHAGTLAELAIRSALQRSIDHFCGSPTSPGIVLGWFGFRWAQ